MAMLRITTSKAIVNILLAAFSILIGLVILESTARIIWTKKYNQRLATMLHGFDYVDYERSIIIPTANTQVTVARYKDDLIKHGKTVGLKHFEESIQHHVPPDSAILFRINKHGFKGPNISIPKPASVYRILCIGNSCTWGMAKDYYTYPRAMERELNRLAKDLQIEVVNAGVLGYNFEGVLKRINEFLAVEPDLITIYMGWNRTIGRADPQKNLYLYRKSALYKIFYHFIMSRKDTGLDENTRPKLIWDKNDPSLEGLNRYSFKYDIYDLDNLVKVIKKKDQNTKVILITLAGIFDHRVEPNQRALQIAHPIASTNNLCAYPILTKNFNSELREYARSSDLEIIDFESYALYKFSPRSTYFIDSVHPTSEGYLKMGKFFASELLEHIH